MTQFRTIEVSDPKCESNNLRFVTVKTPNLCGRGDLTVFVPKDSTKYPLPLPIVTLLHGVYGSHWSWAHQAGVHLTSQRMIDAGEIPPMLIAMPSDGLMFDGTAYLAHNKRNFAAWIVDDVPAAVLEAGCPTSSHAIQFIAGLSMGGFGALRLGASNPEQYSAFAGHSSITKLEEMTLFIEEELSLYGESNSGCSVLSTILHHIENIRPFRFDCGLEDELIDGNRTLHQELIAHQIEHEYCENPGGHEWSYWAEHIGDTLRFFASFL